MEGLSRPFDCADSVSGCSVRSTAMVYPERAFSQSVVSVCCDRGVCVPFLRTFDSEEDAVRAAHAAHLAVCSFLAECGPSGLSFEEDDGTYDWRTLPKPIPISVRMPVHLFQGWWNSHHRPNPFGELERPWKFAYKIGNAGDLRASCVESRLFRYWDAEGVFGMELFVWPKLDSQSAAVVLDLSRRVFEDEPDAGTALRMVLSALQRRCPDYESDDDGFYDPFHMEAGSNGMR